MQQQQNGVFAKYQALFLAQRMVNRKDKIPMHGFDIFMRDIRYEQIHT